MKPPAPKLNRIPFSESSLKIKPINPYIHPKITTFNEVPEEQKQVLLRVKRFITRNIGECQLTFHGSRVNGNWVEDSDYDIYVHKDVEQEIKTHLRKHDYGARIDLLFRRNPPKEGDVVF